MRKCIVSTHYNRPICSNWQIQSLKGCIGIDDWDVIFFAEPTMYEVEEVLSEAEIENKNVIINKTLLGKNGNKENALKMVEKDYDFILFLEDNTILAKDSLQLMNWAIDNIKAKEDEYLTVSPYNWFTRDIYKDENMYKLQKHHGSNIPFCFGYWSNTKEENKTSYQIRPVLSRANNIGFLEGKESDLSLEFLVKKMGHDVYDINGVYSNPLGREWIKVDDETIYSKPDISMYLAYLHKDWSNTLISESNGGYFIEC